jgi:hypothetical protein
VIGGIKEQETAVAAELKGEKLKSTTFDTKNGPHTRGFVRRHHEKDGVVFSQVRYGQQAVFKQPDGKKPMAFEARKTLADPTAFYDTLIAAIERGELDKQLIPLQAATSASLKGRPGKKKAAAA